MSTCCVCKSLRDGFERLRASIGLGVMSDSEEDYDEEEGEEEEDSDEGEEDSDEEEDDEDGEDDEAAKLAKETKVCPLNKP